MFNIIINYEICNQKINLCEKLIFNCFGKTIGNSNEFCITEACIVQGKSLNLCKLMIQKAAK